MIPDVNKMTLTRQLRAAVTILHDNERLDLAQFRQILLGRDLFNNLTPVDSNKGPIFDVMWQEGGNAEQRFQLVKRQLFVISSVNESQARAVNMAFNSCAGLSLIVGPPGNGKTTTLALVAILAHCAGHKVLVTAASNAASNRVMEDIKGLMKDCVDQPDFNIPLDVNLVRLHRPGSESEYARKHTKSSTPADDMELVADEELQQYFMQRANFQQ